MIKGIGTDIIEIDRVADAAKRSQTFMTKMLTDKEYKILEEKGFKKESLAGRFAAKEAVSKALGTGFRTFSLKDIEVLNDPLGKPYVELKGNALERLKAIKGTSIHLSISHCKTYVVAYAVIEEA